MTVTVIDDKAWMRGAFFVTWYHPNCWRVVPFLLFPLPVLFMLGIAVRSDLTVLSNFLFALEFTGGWVGVWIVLFLLSLAYVKQTLKRPSTVTISSGSLRCENWVSKWTGCKGVMCTATDILIFQSASIGIAVPLNAFADPREAQCFYETAVGYWQSAKTGQPFTHTNETGVWPPAPAAGNSAEPGDSPPH